MCGSGLEAPWAGRWPGATVHEPVVILRPERVQIGAGSRVDAFCKIEGGGGVDIGRNVHIASYCHLNIGGGRLVLWDGACLASGVRIVTGSHSLAGVSCSSCCPDSEQVIERGVVNIGAHAIVWTGAIILPNVTIGGYAAIGAGSVVRHNVPAWEVWAGNPARFIKRRERPASRHVDADGTYSEPFNAARHLVAWGGTG